MGESEWASLVLLSEFSLSKITAKAATVARPVFAPLNKPVMMSITMVSMTCSAIVRVSLQ